MCLEYVCICNCICGCSESEVVKVICPIARHAQYQCVASPACPQGIQRQPTKGDIICSDCSRRRYSAEVRRQWFRYSIMHDTSWRKAAEEAKEEEPHAGKGPVLEAVSEAKAKKLNVEAKEKLAQAIKETIIVGEIKKPLRDLNGFDTAEELLYPPGDGKGKGKVKEVVSPSTTTSSFKRDSASQVHPAKHIPPPHTKRDKSPVELHADSIQPTLRGPVTPRTTFSNLQFNTILDFTASASLAALPPNSPEFSPLKTQAEKLSLDHLDLGSPMVEEEELENGWTLVPSDAGLRDWRQINWHGKGEKKARGHSEEDDDWQFVDYDDDDM